MTPSLTPPAYVSKGCEHVRVTPSQRSLLLSLGEPDRHGLRRTAPVSRARQSSWLQSALALFRRGMVEKHREDGTHAIGDGAGRVWLTLTPEGESLRSRISGDAPCRKRLERVEDYL